MLLLMDGREGRWEISWLMFCWWQYFELFPFCRPSLNNDMLLTLLGNNELIAVLLLQDDDNKERKDGYGWVKSKEEKIYIRFLLMILSILLLMLMEFLSGERRMSILHDDDVRSSNYDIPLVNVERIQRNFINFPVEKSKREKENKMFGESSFQERRWDDVVEERREKFHFQHLMSDWSFE